MSTVVFAATSQTGSVAIETLLKAGVPNIVAVARSKAKIAHLEAKGVKTIEADITDGEAVAAALEGAKAAYVINPPIFDGSDPVAFAKANIASYSQALKKHNVPRVVLLSSIGAERTSGTGLVAVLNWYEKELSAFVPELVVLRPAYFLSNFYPALQGAVPDPHTFMTLLPRSNEEFDMIAPTDIGKIAGDYLAIPSSELAPSGPTIVEIKGLQAWSVDDVGKAVEKALGSPVKVVTTPDDKLEATLAATMPPALAGTFVEMIRGMASGIFEWTGEGKVERGPTTLEAHVGQVLAQKQ